LAPNSAHQDAQARLGRRVNRPDLAAWLVDGLRAAGRLAPRRLLLRGRVRLLRGAPRRRPCQPREQAPSWRAALWRCSAPPSSAHSPPRGGAHAQGPQRRADRRHLCRQDARRSGGSECSGVVATLGAAAWPCFAAPRLPRRARAGLRRARKTRHALRGRRAARHGDGRRPRAAVRAHAVQRGGHDLGAGALGLRGLVRPLLHADAAQHLRPRSDALLRTPVLLHPRAHAAPACSRRQGAGVLACRSAPSGRLHVPGAARGAAGLQRPRHSVHDTCKSACVDGAQRAVRIRRGAVRLLTTNSRRMLQRGTAGCITDPKCCEPGRR